jgi:hypothetical protein
MNRVFQLTVPLLSEDQDTYFARIIGILSVDSMSSHVIPRDRKGIDTGRTKSWGINPGGDHGFSVTDVDEKEIFAKIA